jgi:hypothetical protein
VDTSQTQLVLSPHNKVMATVLNHTRCTSRLLVYTQTISSGSNGSLGKQAQLELPHLNLLIRRPNSTHNSIRHHQPLAQHKIHKNPSHPNQLPERRGVTLRYTLQEPMQLYPFTPEHLYMSLESWNHIFNP